MEEGGTKEGGGRKEGGRGEEEGRKGGGKREEKGRKEGVIKKQSFQHGTRFLLRNHCFSAIHLILLSLSSM